METVKKDTAWKERKMLFLEERLDEVEKELHSLPHKIYELEHRRKSILKRMEELTDDKLCDDIVHQQLFGIK
jgi:hypothetical protein